MNVLASSSTATTAAVAYCHRLGVRVLGADRVGRRLTIRVVSADDVETVAWDQHSQVVALPRPHVDALIGGVKVRVEAAR